MDGWKELMDGWTDGRIDRGGTDGLMIHHGQIGAADGALEAAFLLAKLMPLQGLVSGGPHFVFLFFHIWFVAPWTRPQNEGLPNRD